MLSSFNMTQSDSIQLLPLLFHVNHPMLPGYIDKDTPCGIPDYSPDNTVKSIAKTASRSFKYKSRAYLRFEVVALYLMGSAGTLAQTFRSDLDLWICINEKMSPERAQKLERKAGLITQWMAERGIELNCYLVNKNDFQGKTNKIFSTESCGDTQNYLLLDEFYRTAIWLCGRMPLWWVVPVDEDYISYAKRLIMQKHLDETEWIDFGPVESIPPEEYFSASLWQLYKSIQSPYKSLLKLLLLEVYARHSAKTDLLSSQFKQRVYLGEIESQELDPYLFMFNYAESFVVEQPQRLEFLRRAFYLKTGSKIQLKPKGKVGWRYRTLVNIVQSWGWNQKRLEYLNHRGSWKINIVLKERAELVRELNHSYHFLANFARKQGVADQVSQSELLSLGRKLYSVFEKRAGKIEVINTGIVRDLSEPALTMVEGLSRRWSLFVGAVQKEKIVISQPVYTADTMFMLIAWCICNQIANEYTSFQVFASDPYLNQKLAHRVARQLQKLCQKRQSKVDDEAFQHPAVTVKVGVFVATRKDPLREEKSSRYINIGQSSDHFCWGEERRNLLNDFEVFSTNSWGENICKNYRGTSAWIQFFQDNRDILADIDEKMEIFADTLPQPEKLKRRIRELMVEWNRLIINQLKKHKNYRYLMSFGREFLRINFDEEGISYQSYPDLEQMLYSLAEFSTSRFEHVVDEHLNVPPLISKMIARKSNESINCYIAKISTKEIQVFVKEPQGHLFYQRHRDSSEEHLMTYYQQFIDSINLTQGFLSAKGVECLFWYSDLTGNPENFRFNKIKPEKNTLPQTYWRIKAIGCFNSIEDICFDLYCGPTVYRYRDYGDLVYRKLAQYIIQQRGKSEHYPIYITDLDLSAVIPEPHLCHYFEYKREIENRLKNTLDKLK